MREYKISSNDDIKKLEEKISLSISSIEEERKSLRTVCNRISLSEDKKKETKIRISKLTNCRKILSNEMKICERIENRAENIHRKLLAEKAEEEKYLRKEREHEHLR